MLEILQKGAKDNYCTKSQIVRLALNHYFSKKGWFVKYGSSEEKR